MSVAGKTLPAFPAHAQPAILRIWLEAHETGGGKWLCYKNYILDAWNMASIQSTPILSKYDNRD